MIQLWSWGLAAVGLTGLYLAGRKLRAGWAVGLLAQVLWFTYGMVTGQLGFLVSAVAYAAVNTRNFLAWSQPAMTDPPAPPPAPAPVFHPLESALTAEERDALPEAVIVDLDGTLCLHVARGPFEWHKVRSDAVNPAVLSAVRAHHRAGAAILFTSGRPDHTREDTETWLAQHAADVPYRLFMRRAEDFRNDAVVKYEMFRDNIHDRFRIIMVIDDRNRVVDMWRAIGLWCAQIAPGDF